MILRHPFDRWPVRRRGAALLAVAVGTVATDIPLLLVNRRLDTEVSPNGILSLELAWNAERVEEIVGTWEQAGALTEAAFSSGFDFLFMLLYAVATAGACAGLARRGWRPGVGAVLAWAGLAAGVFDATETAIQSSFVLGSEPTDAAATAMSTAAVVKFGLLALCLLYLAIGLPALLLRRDREPGTQG